MTHRVNTFTPSTSGHLQPKEWRRMINPPHGRLLLRLPLPIPKLNLYRSYHVKII